MTIYSESYYTPDWNELIDDYYNLLVNSPNTISNTNLINDFNESVKKNSPNAANKALEKVRNYIKKLNKNSQ